MSVRNCGELGINLQRIMLRLLDNQDLCKLLYYTDKDPLAQPDIENTDELINGLISIIPKNNPVESAQSKIILVVDSGVKMSNDEFSNIGLRIYIYVPMTQWIIKSDNLRPFLIMGEVQESLHNKNINGLGRLSFEGFDMVTMTEQMTIYRMDFNLTQFL